MMKVIGLTSPKQGGKDMVADILYKQLSDYYVTYINRFADPLKGAVAALFDWDIDKLNDDIDFKESIDPRWGISPRIALQIIGTEMFRDGPLKTRFGINFWVQCMRNELTRMSEFEDTIIIIPDCRFMDEFNLVKEFGGDMVFMDPRPRIEPEMGGHASEKDMWLYHQYDRVIDTGHAMELTRQQARVYGLELLETL